MPRRRTRPRVERALDLVRRARDAAKNALDSLRAEIRRTTARLEELVLEERSFRSTIFGTAPAARSTARPGPGRRRRRRAAGGLPRRQGRAKAERYFAKLPNAFTLDDVRKLAGPATGISLAQWSRAKRIRKTSRGYLKIR